MTLTDLLSRITAAFDAAAIQYMLVGSFASTYYGLPRSTLDIDFVIEATAQQVRDLIQHLPSEAYYVELDTALDALRQRSMFNVIDIATSWKIDLIFGKGREFDLAEFARRRRINYQGVSLFITSPEGSVLAKLEWARLGQSQRQIEDAAGILKVLRQSLDYTYLKTWIEGLQLQREWRDAAQAAGISGEFR
jgi:hypothetical protein